MIILHILKVILIILEVLVIFNLMIIVHELGHFLAARWRGLVVEKFGIWFGKPLWKKKINGVEYSLGSIPAGGFVALPQLAPMEVMEGKVETPREQLPPISVLDKIIVAFAGPLFSFLLAVVFAIAIWKVGRPVSEAERTKVIGYVGEKTPAAEAGLKVGDEILSVDGHPVTRYQGMSADSIQWSIVRSEGEKVEIVVKREGLEKPLPVWVQPKVPEKANWWNRKNLRIIGIGPSTSSIVAEVQPDTAGAKAGLRKDDKITAINGQMLYSPDGIYEYAKDHPTGPYQLTVERPDAQSTLPLAKRPKTKLTLPFDPQGVRIASVEKESPASAAGLQKDDVVVGIDDKKTDFVTQLIDYVGSHPNVPITLHVQRADKMLDLKVTPQVPVGLPPEMEKQAKIGAVLEGTDGLAFEGMGESDLVRPNPIEQVRLSVMAIVNTLDAVLSRKSSVSVQHMGGPVMMMNAYYHMLSSPEGIRMAIWFSVVLNVNLALLNLLPIPVLDGGHITLAIIEAVRRKPMNVRVLEYVQTACALVIIGFMLFIMFFDVQDLPFVGAKRPSLHFQKTAEEPAR
jgi:regulator of sigma E protease